jgi:3alpha(or 20beta)-hydroxysteroid dehydrogenase
MTTATLSAPRLIANSASRQVFGIPDADVRAAAGLRWPAMARVDGKIVLVSGGARGMGAAHAEALASEGGRVLIGDVLDDAGRKVAEKLGDAGCFVHLDVTDADQWDAAVDAALTRFGRLDALGNNAGIVKIGPLRGSSVADWQH